MRTPAINYVIVGLFVLAAIVGVVLSLAMLTGRTGATDRYFTIYDNVGGVKFGTPVLFEGYTIGQVEDVEPEITDAGTRFRVEIAVEEGWPIPEDSSADVTASGFLGGVMINISAGDSRCCWSRARASRASRRGTCLPPCPTLPASSRPCRNRRWSPFCAVSTRPWTP